jgi:adenosine deaminase
MEDDSGDYCNKKDDHGPVFYQIITCLRDFGLEDAICLCKLAIKCAAEEPALRVCGVDLAGNEYLHPPEKFASAFEMVFQSNVGLGITIHAGEGTSEAAAKNIRTSVESLHATRIGHGVAARQSEELRTYLREKNIAIEICPTSNVHTGSISSIADHPAGLYVKDGITIIPCCDNSLLSQTSTSKEYSALLANGILDEEALANVASKAHAVAFRTH